VTGAGPGPVRKYPPVCDSGALHGACVIGDDPGGQVAPLGVLVARLPAEDVVVVGGIASQAEPALDAAAEVGRAHQRADYPSPKQPTAYASKLRSQEARTQPAG
jgi:hypothetical protein